MSQPARPNLAVVVGSLAALVACSEGPTEARRCLRLDKAQDWPNAAEVCTRAFAATARPRIGMAAARAHYVLGQNEDALRLTGALMDGDQAASAHHLVGRIHLRRGELEAGQRELREALRLHQLAGQHGAAVTDAVVLHGVAYRSGRYRDAIALAEVAEREAVAADDPRQRSDALLARADMYVALGALAEAAPLYREAAGLAADDPKRQAELDIRQGLLEAARGNVAMARTAYARAHAGAVAAGAEGLASHASSNLADVALREGRVEDAAGHLADARARLPASAGPSRVIPFNQALVELRRGRLEDASAALALAAAAPPEPEWTWQIEELAGTIAVKRGDPDGAAAAYRRSIAVIEASRGVLDSNLLKSSFLHERRGPYEGLFALQVQRGDAVGAFATMERLAARTFLDAVVAASAGRAGDAAQPDVAAALTRTEVLGELVPAVQTSTLFAPIDPGEVLTALRADTVLSYVEIGEQLWCVAIVGGTPRAIPLAATVAEVRDLADQLLITADDPEVAAKLGDVLLPRALGRLPDATIHVVPGLTLARVPFALLRRGGVPLLDRHRFVYTPSATALIALRRRDDPAPAPAVVLGDSRGDLPAAAAEATRVAEVLGVDAAVGPAATADTLRAAARARVLHVATHSGVDLRGAWLALAGGDVRGDEILTWRLAPRLVVLASCASAATTRREYWGSLGAAFLAAGSRAVVASLWSVDDRATAAFMDAFYRHGGADAPAEALARTQRELARTHPSGSWSAFVLIGTDITGGESP